MNENQANNPRNFFPHRYPYDFEEFDSEDFQTLARQKIFLRIAITDFHQSIDRSEKETARKIGRQYISDLQIRESMRVALECWYDERLASVA
jgi:hypothetical protein